MTPVDGVQPAGRVRADTDTRQPAQRVRVIACTAGALIGFAGNSLLTRAGVGGGAVDAASFTSVRLATGALTLLLLLRLRGSTPVSTLSAWPAASALTGYIVAFSFAYERVGASLGALLLFGSVQLTMMGWGLWRGERPHWADWSGLAFALGGLVALVAPGLTAPDPLGAVLMAVAGVSWGAYSLVGRGVGDPLAATTAAFTRALAAGLIVSLLTASRAHATTHGLLLAAVSGALASGVGYTLWYAALPSLTPWRAGLLQLLVPALTAAGAVVMLGERPTRRLVGSGAAILIGVALPMAWHALVRRAR